MPVANAAQNHTIQAVSTINNVVVGVSIAEKELIISSVTPNNIYAPWSTRKLSPPSVPFSRSFPSVP